MVDRKETFQSDLQPPDLTHDELLHTLTGLQADVEARDIVIALLQREQRYLIVDDAKRHKYFLEKTIDVDLDDPILALQRDSHFQRPSFNSLDNRNCDVTLASPRNVIGVHLEEIADAHRRTHAFLCEQLESAEQRYTALCNSFEEERKRLEKDAAHGDDVVAMLEKEREKLLVELENERCRNKRLENELKLALDNYNSQKSLSQRQRLVAAQLIKERKRLSKELLLKCERIEQLEYKLGQKSLPRDVPADEKILNPPSTRTVKPTVAVRSPIAVDSIAASREAEAGGNGSLSCSRKSVSPPPKCCESINSTSSLPSPVVPPSHSDMGPGGVAVINGCSPTTKSSSSSSSSSSSFDGPAKVLKEKSPPPFKARPEPPIRRTPEYNSPPTRKTSPRPVSPLKVNTTPKNEKRPTTPPSPPPPPPPPPQMQLHYPYPGMQGNTHHPPIRSSRAFGSLFGSNASTFSNSSGVKGGAASPSSSSSSSQFASVQSPLTSPSSPPPTPHQFPYSQKQFSQAAGGSASRFGAAHKVSSLNQQQQPPRSSTSTGGYPLMSRPVVAATSTVNSVPRGVGVLVSRTGPSSSSNQSAATTTGGVGNLYANGK